MTKFSMFLFVIIHQDEVIAYASRLEDLWERFGNYLGSQGHVDRFRKMVEEQQILAGKIQSFSFIIEGNEYHFQQLEKRIKR
ncbi:MULTISPECIES: hypothetical protein [Olivibacter]|uniref:Uncharacterized protein n=1 Tax=Olivibacter oleidegradans TaxID=760123 RepID=A0ABV6HNT3_9SPHI|nr:MULTISPECIES: hypothetical protein [Olivibacter]MDM8173561.1 hypothetical protein [Olivibacter sp. 47]QEL03277.1 hypothetical protein FKG96_21435 [Olivibacter sp. LS-1]